MMNMTSSHILRRTTGGIGKLFFEWIIILLQEVSDAVYRWLAWSCGRQGEDLDSISRAKGPDNSWAIIFQYSSPMIANQMEQLNSVYFTLI